MNTKPGTATVCLLLIALFALCACRQESPERKRAAEIYEQGVAINIEAIRVQDRGDWDRAAALNQQSLVKFREAFALDSSHPLIRRALGHCLYIDRQFDEAIPFFEAAVKADSKDAAVYRELGLCRINTGDFHSGRSDIDRAMHLDKSGKVRQMTVQDLEAISDRAFSYSESYKEAGEIENCRNFARTSLQMLALALEYDPSNKRLEEKLTDLAQQTGNSNELEIFKQMVH